MEGGHKERDVQHHLDAKHGRDALAGMPRYDQLEMEARSKAGVLPLDSVAEEDEDSMLSEASHLCVWKMKLSEFKAQPNKHFDIL